MTSKPSNPETSNDNDASNGISKIADAINNAEEFKNPLDDLIERCKEDPGEAFKPDVLEELANLKKEDLAKFESLRAKLKKARCHLRALDSAIKEQNDNNGGNGHNPNHANILINFTEDEGVELFHTKDKDAYVDVDNEERRETYNVRSKGFQHWLRGQFFEKTGSAPTSESLQTALATIEAKAIFKGEKREVFLRIGTFEGRIYIDLAGDDWRSIEIDTKGWRVIPKPPIRFRRTAGMQELPTPKKGGSIDELKEFLNVQSDDDFVLLVAWLLTGFRGQGPYPVIVLSGEQGSAKTTFSNILRYILDPNKAPSRALPSNDRDLFISANNSHVLAFDNVSYLRSGISDSLCRLSTGASFGTRKLLTDQDEILFKATKPIILNSIEDIVTRPDLADRALFFTLKEIPEHQRLSEMKLLEKFEVKRPYILGVLLNALVEGLNHIDEIDLPTLPRMADFAEWGVATETALWKQGTFWKAYQRNRDNAIENVIESNPVASALLSIMANRNEWEGTATNLLNTLVEEVGEKVASSKSFPKSASSLSGRIRRVATFLRKIGIEIEYSKQGRSGKRITHIRKVKVNQSTVASAQPSEWDFSMDEDDSDVGNGRLVAEMDQEDKGNYVSKKAIQDEHASKKAEKWNEDVKGMKKNGILTDKTGPHTASNSHTE